MQLYFIRHAQSENNAIWAATQSDVGRKSDPELTEIGERQGQAVADFLSQTIGSVEFDGYNKQGFHFTHLYSSLMVRAVKTGTYISQAMGVPLVAWPEIHESGGIFEKNHETGERTGLDANNRAYFEQHYPDLVLPDDFGEEGWWGKRPFEPREEMVTRANQFLHNLYARHGKTEDRVAIVSHGGFFYGLMLAILQFSRHNEHLDTDPTFIWLQKNNASVSRIDFVADTIQVKYMNRIDYFPLELIT
ncbi:MAG: histidine phosphatase family protein [Chloroflexota bacterium]